MECLASMLVQIKIPAALSACIYIFFSYRYQVKCNVM